MYRQFENPTGNEDEIEIQPWPPIELVGRAAVFASLARRYGIELELAEGGDPFDLETERFDLSAWARTELGTWLTDDELRVLNTANGAFADEDADLCEDAIVGGVAVIWARGVVPLDRLPWDQVDELEAQLVEWAPKPWGNVRPLVKNTRVRSDEDLAAERERWELWYWRSSFDDELDGDDRAAIAETAGEAQEAGLIAMRNGDFLVDDRTYGELDPLEREAVAGTAYARLKALNWVCGLGETWDTTPLLID
ncbi:MAG: hypothetical protein WBA46_11565 [Thermomicrobiales bacterium]